MASSGIQSGDYISKINGKKVATGSEMVEQIASFKPGDKISVNYIREGKEFTTNITLKNKAGSYEIVKTLITDKLGAELQNLDKKKATTYGVKGGVVVTKISAGLIDDQTRMRDGFVILKVNGTEVKSIDELNSAMKTSPKRATFEGFYPGFEGVYQYPVELAE
jgi:S1-C subfamily serine protease